MHIRPHLFYAEYELGTCTPEHFRFLSSYIRLAAAVVPHQETLRKFRAESCLAWPFDPKEARIRQAAYMQELTVRTHVSAVVMFGEKKEKKRAGGNQCGN